MVARFRFMDYLDAAAHGAVFPSHHGPVLFQGRHAAGILPLRRAPECTPWLGEGQLGLLTGLSFPDRASCSGMPSTSGRRPQFSGQLSPFPLPPGQLAIPQTGASASMAATRPGCRAAQLKENRFPRLNPSRTAFLPEDGMFRKAIRLPFPLPRLQWGASAMIGWSTGWNSRERELTQ